MLNYLKINELINNNSDTKQNFYRVIGVTQQGFKQTMENKTMKVETLERIAEYFDKPIGYFFDEVAPDIIQEPAEIYGNEYKVKYYELLEKYTNCLEEKDSLYKSGHEPKKDSKTIISKSQLK